MLVINEEEKYFVKLLKNVSNLIISQYFELGKCMATHLVSALFLNYSYS